MLTGCWTGGHWYAASDSRPVLPDGRYRLVTDEMPGKGDVLSIHRRPDGATAIEGGDNPLIAVLVPLGGASPHRHVVQLQRDDGVARRALFILLDDSGGRYRLALLPCSGSRAEAARASGGSIARDPQSAATCNFGTREALLANLVAVSRDARFDLELVRQVP